MARKIESKSALSARRNDWVAWLLRPVLFRRDRCSPDGDFGRTPLPDFPPPDFPVPDAGLPDAEDRPVAEEPPARFRFRSPDTDPELVFGLRV